VSATLPLFLFLFLAACAQPGTTSTQAEPAPGPAQPGPPQPGPAAGAEDLSSSWRPSLAVAVPAPPPGGACVDADGDGFPAAQGCNQDAATLDCDDADPAVTPNSERWVPPGPFLMGSASSQAGGDEGPVHVVFLSGYCLDRTAASASQFAPGEGSSDQPATGLSWEDAKAWCRAQGKQLPTEAQWEKAARGGCELGTDPTACDPADLRPYPWGTDAPSCELANHRLTGASGFAQLCVDSTLPVDALPAGAGPYGHIQLAGNVWEWVADRYHPAVYKAQGRRDPAGPQQGSNHVLRGGSFSTFSTNMRVANRFSDLVMGSITGVRCARPTVTPIFDPVPPLKLVALSGTVTRKAGPLAGRALYITAFPADALDPKTKMLVPGRSPVAENRLVPNGQDAQTFTLQVPIDGSYILTAALDAGEPAGSGALAPSGTGGTGSAAQNPVDASHPQDGLTIVIEALPQPGGRPAGGAPAGGK